MPEEEAFIMLVKIMYDYHVREMFKSGFAELHLKFYQVSAQVNYSTSINVFKGNRVSLYKFFKNGVRL